MNLTLHFWSDGTTFWYLQHAFWVASNSPVTNFMFFGFSRKKKNVFHNRNHKVPEAVIYDMGGTNFSNFHWVLLSSTLLKLFFNSSVDPSLISELHSTDYFHQLMSSGFIFLTFSFFKNISSQFSKLFVLGYLLSG